MPMVKAGNRICQPITQANCRRDSRTGSRSMIDPPVALGNKTDKRSESVRSRLHRCCHQGQSSNPEQFALARVAHDLSNRQSQRRDRKDLPLETRIELPHLHANALKFRACGALCEVRLARGDVGEGALPSDIRLAAVTAGVFDEYFTGWKPDRDAHGGRLASYIEDLGGQTRLGVVMRAFDGPDGAGRGDRALSEYGSSRHSSGSRKEMQKPPASKLHGSSSGDRIFGRLRPISPALRSRISPPSPTSRFRPR